MGAFGARSAIGRPRAAPVLFAMLLSMVASSPAWAECEPEGQARARELFDAGVASARTGDLDAAIAALAESERLCPQPGTLYNLGLVQMEAGHRAAAYRSLGEIAGHHAGELSSRARVEVSRRLRELEAELARVTITTSPEGALVTVDGLSTGATPLPDPVVVEPGVHVFAAALEGYQGASERRDLAAGAEVRLELRLDRAEEPGPVLVLESASEGARASVDGGPAQPLPARLQLETGEHELTVEAPGYLPSTERVSLPESGEVRRLVSLVPSPGSARPEEGAVEEAPPLSSSLPAEATGGPGGGDAARSPQPSFWRTPWPWVIGGTVAAGVVATVLAVTLTPTEPVPDARVRLP